MHFIDAHHHLWDLDAVHYPWLVAYGEKRFFGDPTPIQKNYLLEDFLHESSRYVPAQSVHIQVGTAVGEALRETEWLSKLGEKPEALVAFCDLAGPHREPELDAQQHFAKVRGIRQILGRHVVEDRKHGSDALLEDPKFLDGLKSLTHRNLSYDCQLIPEQHGRAAKLFAQAEALPVVICHAGSPWDQSPAGLAQWQETLGKLAELPNVHCKLSGLGMFNPNWDEAAMAQVCHRVIDCFGPERIMVGSNYPVDKLYRPLDDWWSAIASILSRYSVSEQQAMLYRTATRFYRL